MNRNVLVIADQFPEHHGAMQSASKYVDAEFSNITITAFIDMAGLAGSSLSLNEKKSQLQSLVNDCFKHGENINCEVVATANISEYCRTYCDDNNIELVVKTGHRSESIFYTPLDWQLLRHLPCPLLIANPIEVSHRKVLLATVDAFNKGKEHVELDKKVLIWAAQMAKLRRFELHVTSCIEASDAFNDSDEKILENLVSLHEKEVQQYVDNLMTDINLDYAGLTIVAGKPENLIPRVAVEQDVALVAIGSVARSGLQGFLLGNTGEKVMHNLKTDLAIIPATANL